MPQVVTVHSYRGGTGKSNLTVNIAASIARRRKKVAILDTDLQSPGAHVIFGFTKEQLTTTLVDFVYNRCELVDAAYDVSKKMGCEETGSAWLVPASLTLDAISKIVAEGYDVKRMSDHMQALIDTLKLDYLFIDTHPGLNRETMMTLTVSDVLVLVIRPDEQDFHGTGVLLQVARKLEVPKVCIIANKVVSRMDSERTAAMIKESFGQPVIGLLPLSEDMASLGSRGIFVIERPEHDISRRIGAIADHLLVAAG